MNVNRSVDAGAVIRAIKWATLHFVYDYCKAIYASHLTDKELRQVSTVVNLAIKHLPDIDLAVSSIRHRVNRFAKTKTCVNYSYFLREAKRIWQEGYPDVTTTFGGVQDKDFRQKATAMSGTTLVVAYELDQCLTPMSIEEQYMAMMSAFDAIPNELIDFAAKQHDRVNSLGCDQVVKRDLWNVLRKAINECPTTIVTPEIEITLCSTQEASHAR